MKLLVANENHPGIPLIKLNQRRFTYKNMIAKRKGDLISRPFLLNVPRGSFTRNIHLYSFMKLKYVSRETIVPYVQVKQRCQLG